MTGILVDSYAWAEMLKGSELGVKARKLVENEEITATFINEVEVFKFLLREKMHSQLEKMRDIFSKIDVLQADHEIAETAARICLERKMGLADAVILATAKKHGLKILTGDKHFQNVKDVKVLML